MSDLINRQDAIEAIHTWDKFGVDGRGRVVRWYEGLEPYVHLRDVVFVIENLPSAQPEITLESAIDYLHSIGWMQEHDRIMAKYAPVAHAHNESETGFLCSACRFGDFGQFNHGGKYIPNYCPNCGSKMDKE